MRYGFVLLGGDVWTIPEMAAEAEAAGWDGVFIADCISINEASATLHTTTSHPRLGRWSVAAPEIYAACPALGRHHPTEDGR